MDTTFDFEKIRNSPPKYDRELYAATIKAIQKVTSIQYKRQRSFYFNRMRDSLKLRKMNVARELKTNLDMVLAPVAAKRRLMEKEKLADSNTLDDEIKLRNGSKSVIKGRQVESDSDDSDAEVDDN